MKPRALQNLFGMILSETDRQHRTPVSERNQDIARNRGTKAGRSYIEYWDAGEKRRFFSQQEIGDMRRREAIMNSIRNRENVRGRA